MPHRPLMIGVAGGTGSGKTTVARRVAAALADSSVAFVEMDSYYRNHVGLTMQELHRVNWDHPDAFDVDLFVAHLDAMSRGEPVEKPVYDYALHARSAETVRIPKCDVVVVDGILLFTDGVLEAENQSGEPFFENRLMEIIGAKATEPLEAVLDGVLSSVLAFSEGQHFDDDVCLLGIDVRRP